MVCVSPLDGLKAARFDAVRIVQGPMGVRWTLGSFRRGMVEGALTVGGGQCQSQGCIDANQTGVVSENLGWATPQLD